MLRSGIILSILASALATQAVASGSQREIGYARGALGYEALMRADLSVAEAQLEARRGVAANDPARLLNLALVHWRTGRIASARALFETVRLHRRHFEVELADGSVRDSREVARIALERMNQTIVMR
jgi:Tfp pilus assembly protein PilF